MWIAAVPLRKAVKSQSLLDFETWRVGGMPGRALETQKTRVYYVICITSSDPPVTLVALELSDSGKTSALSRCDGLGAAACEVPC